MLALRWLMLLLCVPQLVGCATQLASQPRIPEASASLTDRQRIYERYRLEESGDNWFGHEWKRADGTYDLEEIDPLLDISAETRSRRSQAYAKAFTVLPMSAVGGALLGMAIGNQLVGNQLFSSKTNTVLYVTGGALSVASLTIAIAWDPVTGMGDAYNAGLAAELGLSSTDTRTPTR